MIGTVFMVLSVGLIAAVGIFMLDVVQIRQLRPAEAQAAVLYGGLFQAVKYVLASVIVAALGFGLRDSARTAERGEPVSPGRGPLMGAKEEIRAPRKSVEAPDSESAASDDMDPAGDDSGDDSDDESKAT